MMIDVTGKPFPEFMRETVLEKAGMTESTYQQPIPPARAPWTATGTRGNGKPVEGRWHIYPEMAAAGLWTTPSDLAKFAIEIALSRQGKANHILSEKMTREMLTPQIKDAGGEQSVGLAFFLGPQSPDQFGHGGADEGFQANLVMFADSGQGLAIMGNSDAFFRVAPYVQAAVAKAYAWKHVDQQHSAADVLILIEAMKGTQAALDLYQQFKAGAVPGYQAGEPVLNMLGYRLLSEQKTDDAIKVFQLNVQEYPKGWNCYDSLAEGYMVAGKTDLAIQYYEKSMELNPQNTNGAEMLKKLRGENAKK